MIFQIVVAGAAVMIASLVGVIFTNHLLGKWLNKNLSLLVSVSAGAFGFLVYNLAMEAIEQLGAWPALAIILISFITSWTGFKLLPFFHHHHSDEMDHHHNKAEGRKILLADAIHNIGDGFVLVAAYMVSPGLGLITVIGIFLHELIQELSEYFVLRQSGYSSRRALALNLAASSTIFIGIVLALFLDQFGIEHYIIAVTSGIFMSVVLQDLIPNTIEAAKEPGKLLPYGVTFLIGVLIMTSLSLVAGHPHDPSEVQEEQEEQEEFSLTNTSWEVFVRV